MKPTFSAHALQEITRRRISREMIEAVLENPQQTLQTTGGRSIYESHLTFEEKCYFLRVVVAHNPPVIVNVYQKIKSPN
jgi:uncharacterized membrane protein YiaA